MARGNGGRIPSARGGAVGGRSSWRDTLTGESSGSKIDGGKDPQRYEKKPKGYTTDDGDDEFVNEFAFQGFHTLTAEQIEEILYLNPSDHPGMQLVAVPLTGTNFVNWSKSVRRALGARSKLELIDGTFSEPLPTDRCYKQWLKTDYMVTSWILNSVSKELINGFNHIDSTRKLWDALVLRFGRCNGPKIYKLQREIFGFMQANQSVVQYFNTLTGMWDELDSLLSPLGCMCAARNKLVQREEQQRLMKFLHGLNTVFEPSKNQILLLEPLPSVDRAYSMIIQMEDEISLSNSVQQNPHMIMNVVDTGEEDSCHNQVFAVGGGKPYFKKKTDQRREETA